MSKDLVFLSFSKPFTGEVASVIENTLNTLYSNKKVTAFLSSTAIKAGNYQKQIDDAMAETKFAVSILSPENQYNSPWLMYEAGALAFSARQNGGELLPYLFCRHLSDIEAPIDKLQVKQYQRFNSVNKSEFIGMFQEINQHLSESNKILELDIEDIINKRWENIDKKLSDIATKIANGAELSEKHESKKINTASEENGAIDLGRISRKLITKEQNSIRLINDFSANTPLEIEKHFESMLSTFVIPEHWQKRNAQDIEYNATRVLVNSTRFSTYVVFTDGTRIVLFDRAAGVNQTTVLNERYDVFGSVQFENRTIKMKIPDENFLNSEIQGIEEITGAAIEDNKDQTGFEAETAVMFGICVYLKSEDLDHAKNNNVGIYPVEEVTNFKKSQLTSKAQLSLQHIIRQLAKK